MELDAKENFTYDIFYVVELLQLIYAKYIAKY